MDKMILQDREPGNAASWQILRYQPQWKKEWDRMVEISRNGTFLFFRDYMEYHSDRFEDCSLIALRKGKPVALLPAERSGGILRSHGGLTYGGWITPEAHFDANDMLELWAEWLEWCRSNGIGAIEYKPVPWIYHRIPAQEDLYAMFRSETDGKAIVKHTECNLSSSIDLRNIRRFNTQQQRNLKKGLKTEGSVEANISIEEFHPLLEKCLRERHDAVPVHSSEELMKLQSSFPENIKIWGFRDSDGLQAGVCMYLCGKTAHCQYIASTPKGRAEGLLTRLFSVLIDEYSRLGFSYFDFGISNEDHARILNSGLLRQKASLGGSGVVYDRYSLEIL